MEPLSKEELEGRSKDTLIQYVGTLQQELAALYDATTKHLDSLESSVLGKKQAE